MTQSLSDHVAAEVRAEVARRRISQRRLAESLGLSQAQISDRMRGAVEFRISELERIAEIFNVPVENFLPERAA